VATKKSVTSKITVAPKSLRSYHVGVAAEAFAAAQFARCGVDVSVQYGANQPEFDLAVNQGDLMMKVSVKGSQDGGWGLTQSLLTKGKVDYHEAIDKWLAKHGKKTVFCLVQFKGVGMGDLPRLYLATPLEIATAMKAVAKGYGGTILYEHHTWTARAKGAGTEERIPDYWKFTKERVIELLTRANDSKATALL
jgi:Holliday junction resolvase-like predicted endonuclease